MQQHLGQNVAVILIADGMAGELGIALLVDFERWNPDHLARLDPGVRLGAAAIDADLARAQQLLQMTETQPREMGLEPAVEPHAGLVGPNRDLFYACHMPVRLVAVHFRMHKWRSTSGLSIGNIRKPDFAFGPMLHLVGAIAPSAGICEPTCSRS